MFISDLKNLGEAIGGGDFKLSIFLVVGGGGGSGDGGVGGDGGDVPKNKVHITPEFSNQRIHRNLDNQCQIFQRLYKMLLSEFSQVA